MAKGLRERVGKQYTGTQRTRKAVHGECTVELAKWTFPIISLCREPYEAKVSRTGLTGGMGRRTVRQRALCLPSGNSSHTKTRYNAPFTTCVRGLCHGIPSRFLPTRADRPGVGVPDALWAVAIGACCRSPHATQAADAPVQVLQKAQAFAGSHPSTLLPRL